MVQVYGALGAYDKATGAMEIVIESRPKAPALYAQLAQLAYAAGQQRKGDLAAQEGHRARPEGPEGAAQGPLKQAETQAIQQQVQGQQGATAPAP